ncbi:MAG: hypothetical protein ACOC7K_00420 [bacterium]
MILSAAGAALQVLAVESISSPSEACRRAEIGMQMLDEACVHIMLMTQLAVGLPPSAGVFSDGSVELEAFRKTCTQVWKSENSCLCANALSELKIRVAYNQAVLVLVCLAS